MLRSPIHPLCKQKRQREQPMTPFLCIKVMISETMPILLRAEYLDVRWLSGSYVTVVYEKYSINN